MTDFKVTVGVREIKVSASDRNEAATKAIDQLAANVTSVTVTQHRAPAFAPRTHQTPPAPRTATTDGPLTIPATDAATTGAQATRAHAEACAAAHPVDAPSAAE